MMELQELDPVRLDGDTRLEPEDARPEGTPPKKRRPRARLWLPLLAAALCAGALALALNWTALQVQTDPLGALKRGAQRVVELPQPLSLGFLGSGSLGEVTLGGETLDAQALNCSGVLEAQADEDGLRLLLSDCTVAGGAFSTTFSVYLSPTEAAARLPDLAGGDDAWYGVRLDVPLAEQGAGTAYERLFTAQQRAQAQESADELRQALRDVRALGLTEPERGAVEAFLAACEKRGERAEGGYALQFTQTDAGKVGALARALHMDEALLGGALTAEFSLNERGALRAVAVESGNLDFTLDLGSDPERELTPRLEAAFDRDGAPCALTLALTAEQAGAVSAPRCADAFALLAP